MATTFAFTNSSQSVTPEILAQWAAALELQLNQDFAPIWVPGERFVVTPDPAAVEETTYSPDGCIVELTDSDPDPQAEGYHTAILDRPSIVIQVPDCQGQPCSVVSHEILETLVDWDADLWQPWPGGTTDVAYEVCDPVEDQLYERLGYLVSNFVTPSWFGQGAGPFDFLGRIGAPDTLSAGGYVAFRDGKLQWGNAARQALKPWRRAMRVRGARP